MRVKAREYKVMVDRLLFSDLGSALRDVSIDLGQLARGLGLNVEGEFDAKDPRERGIRFLDTVDHTLLANELVFRQRVKRKSGAAEYTLKCRMGDRYVAAGTPLEAAPEYARTSHKFEEDVGVPFVSRFSHSVTVDVAGGHALAGENFPKTLAAAAQLFPALALLHHDALPCAPETALAPVNSLEIHERVYTGPEIVLSQARDRRSRKAASVAMILWSRSRKGRILAAELSFRYGSEREIYAIEVASAARTFFARLQRRAWARPDALTKTQFVYEG